MLSPCTTRTQTINKHLVTGGNGHMITQTAFYLCWPFLVPAELGVCTAYLILKYLEEFSTWNKQDLDFTGIRGNILSPHIQ